MPFQLNPSKVPIWKSENELRLGIDGDAQALNDVSNSQERLIQLLFQGIPEDQLGLVGSSVGLTELESAELIKLLEPSLLNTSGRASERSALDVRFAEIIRIGFESDLAPEIVVAERAKCRLHIQTLDRTGLLAVKALSEAGFRKFETSDFEMVRRSDVGELGYKVAQVGISRLAAAREMFGELASGLTLSHQDPKSKNLPELTVFSAMHQINPKEYRECLTPHLVIEYGIDGLRVSPPIKTGVIPCLGCRDLWAAENDPEWASRAIQLLARNDQLDDGVGLLLAVSLATKSICAAIDSKWSNETLGFRVNLRDRTAKEHGWQFHPACVCRTTRK